MEQEGRDSSFTYNFMVNRVTITSPWLSCHNKKLPICLISLSQRKELGVQDPREYLTSETSALAITLSRELTVHSFAFCMPGIYFSEAFYPQVALSPAKPALGRVTQAVSVCPTLPPYTAGWAGLPVDGRAGSSLLPKPHVLPCRGGSPLQRVPLPWTQPG